MKRVFLLIFAAASALLSATDVVKVSDFRPDRSNATSAVQQALDSGARQVLFDNPGFDYIVEPIFLRSNCELIFEDGVCVRALPGSFKGRNDCLFLGNGVENVIMRGQGKVVLSMNKQDYLNSELYRQGEWRHTLCLLGCRNVTIKNLTLKSSGGDGVYIARGKHPSKKNNILLENLLLDDHYRQGISVISVNGLTVRNCRIQNTRGAEPMSGIDFEPNGGQDEVANCLFENTEFLNNARAGIMISCVKINKPVNITFRNCMIAGNVEGINVNAVPSQSSIRFETCKIIDSGIPITIRNKRAGNLLSFSECEIDNKSGKAAVPILIHTEYTENCGGIDFGQLTIRQNLKRKVMVFNGFRGAGLDVPDGKITVISRDGQISDFDLKAFAAKHRPDEELQNFKTCQAQWDDYLPVQKDGVHGHSFNIRDNAVFFVQYCDGKNPVKIHFKTTWKRKNARKPAMPVEFYDPAGTPNGRFVIDKEDFIYVLNGGPGVYRFRIDTKGRAVNIDSSSSGYGFEAASKLKLFRGKGTFYFYVPAGVTVFPVLVQGEPGEAVEAELIDPAGKVHLKTQYEAGAQIMKAERPANAPSEIWRIRILRAQEDYSLRLGAPLPPILYTAPENVLIPKDNDRDCK